VNEMIVKLIEQAVARQQDPLAETKSDDIYDKKNNQTGFKKVPWSIYFTYIGFDEKKKKLRINHYFHPGNKHDQKPQQGETWEEIPLPENTNVDSKLKTALKKLCQNARLPRVSQDPKPYASNFHKIEWRRISYIAIMLDDQDWKLHKFLDTSGKEKRAVIFYDKKMTKTLTPNQSFYDGLDFEIEIEDDDGNVETRPVIVFVNYMKKEGGIDIGASTDKAEYEFGMYFDVELASGQSPPITLIIDPGGTNLGPTVEP
jgi:hypothetical protein